MKNIIFLLSFFSFFTLSAQETIVEKNNIRHEIGVNATLLFKQVLSLSDAKIPVSPYIFTYKMLGKKSGFRAAFGMNMVSNNESQSTFADNKTIKNESANARIGYEWQRAINPKWNVWFGTDLIGSYTNNTNIADSGFDRVSIGSRSQGIGGALALGAEWRFNTHFSIATETSLGVIYINKDDTTKFSGGTQEDTGKTSKGREISSQAPTSIFLVYKF
jgi:hypothetical protein